MNTVERMIKFVEKNGVAKLAVNLNFRDTTRIKNWIARKKIPFEFESHVKNAVSKQGKK